MTTFFTIVIAVVEFSTQFFSYMAAVDSSYICYSLWFVLAGGVGYVLTYASKEDPKLERILYLADMSTVLGLLGSVLGIGFTMSQLKLAEVDFGSKEEIIRMMDAVTQGLGISITTTVTGILASIILSIYVLVLRKH